LWLYVSDIVVLVVVVKFYTLGIPYRLKAGVKDFKKLEWILLVARKAVVQQNRVEALRCTERESCARDCLLR